MKYLFLFFLSIMALDLFADSAPMCEVPGGNVKPISNNDIQLVNEIINITLYPNYYSVEVIYTFKNWGKSQNVKMGFPTNDRFGPNDFFAFENDKKLKTTTVSGYWDFQIPKNMEHCEKLDTTINAFECFEVSFMSDETKTIKNSYKANYINKNDYFFYYILRTGSLWKNKIDYIDVNIISEYIPNFFDISNARFNNEKMSLVNFKKRYINTEPSADLFFEFTMRDYFRVTKASSELKSYKNNSYSSNNIEDGKSSTAWIEGKEGYGIGESITFYTTIAGNQGNPFYIDSIGIINGYAKDNQTFLNNSRVKKISITTNVDNDYESDYNIEKTVLITLKDTMKIQIIKFVKPLHATDIEFTIKDVYNGLKYSDTGLSEIYFYVRKDKN